MNRFPASSALVATVFALVAHAALPGALSAQEDHAGIDRLRQEQQEIVRKTERLQSLMDRLRQRYEREGKKDQVDLLVAGLTHLQSSGILRDVAGIRDDISAAAFSEALRKQKKVVEDLEKLLDILLERQSVESLTVQQQLAAERAASARELERRQRELQEMAQQAMQREPTAAERELQQQLQQLAAAERAESDQNAREAGTRRPYLESALQRVEALLQDEDRLERAAADEATNAQSARNQRQFDLGELTQKARELANHVRGQARQEELQQAAEALQQAAAGDDAQAAQQAKGRLEALAKDPPKVRGLEDDRTDTDWLEVAKNLKAATAGETPAERQALKEAAAAAKALAEQRTKTGAEQNGADSERLADAARGVAERLAQQEPAGAPEAERSSAEVQKAAAALDAAKEAARAGQNQKAQEQVDRALSALERAKRTFAQQNPDAEKKAAEMAAEATATAQELQNAPSAAEAEERAAKELQDAAKALRDLEKEIGSAAEQSQKPQTGAMTKTAREQLEAARSTLQNALQQATANRGQDLQRAQQRQQQLAEQAKQAAEALRRGAENGDLSPQQHDAAKADLETARQQMQQASEQLQNGQQSTASQQQQSAAEALQRAAEQLQRHQPAAPDQKAKLQQQAQEQQDLAEDIVRLARLLERREQEAARRKLDEAAAAARKAKQALEQGDPEQTREQQEEARQKLEEAAKELEEERDRYQDMRQEELLFKMKEELQNFLERQRPISASVREAQAGAKDGKLSRAQRVKVNQYGEEEQELAGRIDFLIQALSEEGNLVYKAVLEANRDDLREVATRLGGRSPDVGTVTTLMQQDVERRSEELLTALENERKRRQQQRQQQQQQQQGQNRMNQQREKLVGLIAELEMLKNLNADTARATSDLEQLIRTASDSTISEPEAALVERLSHRHAEITKLFAAIKAGVEQTLQGMQNQDEHQGGGRGR